VTAEFNLPPGGAWRIRDFTEVGMPEVVTVRAEVARRCEFIRLQYLGGEQWDAPEALCAVFKDPKTGEVYACPVEAP